MDALRTRTRRASGRGPLALTTAAFALASAAGAAAQVVCTGDGNTIGIAIDGSGSITAGSFNTVIGQIADFIDSTSGLASGTANENLYYANVWSTSVTSTTDEFATNAGGAVSADVRAFSFPGGNTNIAVGLQDLTDEFAALSPDASARIGILFTDGNPTAGDTQAAADALRAQGVTVAAVGIGSNVRQSVLEQIASERADGSELVFRTANFGDIGDLFDDVITSIDSDGDGVNDCEDGCPEDPAKLEPGVCGCGVADTDTDGDGTADCDDSCPDDPAKTEPGVCGCGVADSDTDGDGTLDCDDECPEDPDKTEPGECGCGTPEGCNDKKRGKKGGRDISKTFNVKFGNPSAPKEFDDSTDKKFADFNEGFDEDFEKNGFGSHARPPATP